MLVNFIQIAYVLGISTRAAKMLMFPFLTKTQEVKVSDFDSKKIGRQDFIESADLKVLFKHPSPDLDGKDKIEFIVRSLQEDNNLSLRKKIVEDMGCLKAGKITGKYRPLLQILRQEDIDSINTIIKKRRSTFLKSGGKFSVRKPMKGL